MPIASPCTCFSLCTRALQRRSVRCLLGNRCGLQIAHQSALLYIFFLLTHCSEEKEQLLAGERVQKQERKGRMGTGMVVVDVAADLATVFAVLTDLERCSSHPIFPLTVLMCALFKCCSCRNRSGHALGSAHGYGEVLSVFGQKPSLPLFL